MLVQKINGQALLLLSLMFKWSLSHTLNIEHNAALHSTPNFYEINPWDNQLKSSTKGNFQRCQKFQ